MSIATTRIASAIVPLLLLTACAKMEITPPPAVSEQDVFWLALSSHCGKAYEGALVSNDKADADMRSAKMVMHVRTCDNSKITVPFHIKQPDGEWDRSRTWVFTRTDGGLRLKHDHRHKDGSSDAVTMYGGDSADAGTSSRQSFPVDADSIAMFKRGGLDVSITNVWSVETGPAMATDSKFVYQLTRTIKGGAPEPRTFRVEFYFAKPAEIPPAPWGF